MTTRRSTRRAVQSVLCALVLLVIRIGLALPAQAHDTLLSTSPEDGSTVATTPTEVVLTFDQPAVSVGTQLRVSGPDGDVQQGRPQLVDTTVRQAIEPGSPAGTYTVTWRVTSADGHPVSGTFTFTSQAAGEAAASPTGSSVPPSTSASGDPGPTSTTAAEPGTTGSDTSSAISTGESDESGTSWAVWVVLAILVLALAGGAAVRLRRGHGGRGQG